jgi:small subunit ribosomal protein S13
MTEDKKQTEKPQKQEKIAKEIKARPGLINKEAPVGRILRIMQTDIIGNKPVYAGLTNIKGVSWSISNAVCHILNLPKNKKIETLTKEEIQKIEETLKAGKFPKFLLNRRSDFVTGIDNHIIGNDIDLNEELDIKRLKKIRSYRGLRHATGQPTRGQSTRSHFRTNRKKGVGIKVKTKTA